MTQLYRNNATTTLATGIAPGDLTLDVLSGQGVLFPSPGAGESFQLTIVAPSGALEIVTCTSRASDTLTIVRAQEGTTALSFSAGAIVDMRLTRAIMENLPQKDTANTFAEPTTFSDDVTVAGTLTANGPVTLGNSPADAISVAGEATFLEPIIGDLTGNADTATLAATATQAVDSTNATNLTGSGTISDTTTINTQKVGYRDIPQNSVSTAYTFALGDEGEMILHPAADTTARTWTIPANASVAFRVGTAITLVNENGAGGITLDITTDTLYQPGTGATGSRTLASGGMATLLKVTATKWYVSGAGLT